MVDKFFHYNVSYICTKVKLVITPYSLATDIYREHTKRKA